MKIQELLTESENNNIVEAFKAFFPIAIRILDLKFLPKIQFIDAVESGDQPTFGKYDNETNTLTVALLNRNPNDILRTLAHELVHFKQDLDDQLDPNSGDTGSPIENEANAVAGVIMRHFNKQYPQYLKLKPIV